MSMFKHLSNICNYLHMSKLLEKVQLSIIYLFSILKLSFFIQQTLGFSPDLFLNIFPIIDNVLNNTIVIYLFQSDKSMILSVLLLELCIYRSIIKLPKLIKFNIVLGFLLDMCQNLIINLWDLIINRELNTLTVDTLVHIPKQAIIVFFSSLFIIFFCLHTYIFIVAAIFEKIPTLPGPLGVISESAGFWLKFKRRRGKNN